MPKTAVHLGSVAPTFIGLARPRPAARMAGRWLASAIAMLLLCGGFVWEIGTATADPGDNATATVAALTQLGAELESISGDVMQRRLSPASKAALTKARQTAAEYFRTNFPEALFDLNSRQQSSASVLAGYAKLLGEALVSGQWVGFERLMQPGARAVVLASAPSPSRPALRYHVYRSETGNIAIQKIAVQVTRDIAIEWDTQEVEPQAPKASIVRVDVRRDGRHSLTTRDIDMHSGAISKATVVYPNGTRVAHGVGMVFREPRKAGEKTRIDLLKRPVVSNRARRVR